MTTVLLTAALVVGVGCIAFILGALVAASARDEEHTRELREARREWAEGKGE